MRSRLHPVTRFLILAALIHLFGDVFYVAETLARQPPPSVFGLGDDDQMARAQLFELSGRWAHAIALSLSYFAYPAMVEFLVRIWRELQVRNGTAATPGPAA